MANEEQLSILKQGVDRWNTWRQENRDVVVDLRQAKLREVYLPGIDLSEADLRGADLTGAHLRGATLKFANLGQADVEADQSDELLGVSQDEFFSQLFGIDREMRGRTRLEKTDLSNAELTGVILCKASLQHATLERANLISANLSEADVRYAKLAWADLSFANLSKANLSETDLTSATLSDANLMESNLSDASLGTANLCRANLSGAKLMRAFLWLARLIETNFSKAFLSEARIYGTDLRQAILAGAVLSETDLSESILDGLDLTETDLFAANLRDARLNGTDLSKADLSQANLLRASLVESNLEGADLSGADLSRANLNGANLTNCNLVGSLFVQTEVQNAIISGSSIYGVNVWDLRGKFKEQKDLVISYEDEPVITVDNIKIAQFIYLLLNNKEIQDVINTLTSKSVLILGRFTGDGRKEILDALRDKLRELGLLPLVFDFDRPTDRDYTETVQTLAGLSLFVIVDVTTPKSTPLEMEAIVKQFKIPYLPIIDLSADPRPFAMIVDSQKSFHWVLKTYGYKSKEELLDNMEDTIIARALDKHNKLREQKAAEPEILTLDDIKKARK